MSENSAETADLPRKIEENSSADSDVRAQTLSADIAGTSDVASRLRQAVKEAGGNRAVSEKSGVPIGTLGSALSAGSMRLQTAQQLAAATGVRLEWLATGEGPMRPGEAPPGQAAEPAKAQETAPQPPATPLFLRMNMDYLVDAYEVAFEHLSKSGTHKPDSRRLMQVTMLFYEELLEAAERGEIPTEPTNRD